MNKLDINVRSIINGEVPGSWRMLLLTLTAVVVWGAGMYYSSLTVRIDQSLTLQRGRLATLGELAVEYKQLAGGSTDIIKTAAADIVPVFSQIVEEAGLRDRLLQISPVSRGVSVQLDRLYMEELVLLLKGMNKFGIRVMSSEIRALPFQDKRLFSVLAILGVEE